MAGPATKVPVKTEEKPIERSTALQAWLPFESLRREIDHLFGDFDRDYWRLPFRRSIFDVELDRRILHRAAHHCRHFLVLADG